MFRRSIPYVVDNPLHEPANVLNGIMSAHPSGSRDADLWQGEYVWSLRVLAITDSSLDQVVYRLNGLTDEGIAIVEGSATSSMSVSDPRDEEQSVL